MTLEQDSRVKFLKLLGYSKDEFQKKVSCFHIRNVHDSEKRILSAETISEYFLGFINGTYKHSAFWG